MKSAFAKDIVLIICLKVILLSALWFFFIKNHEVVYGSEETGAHILGSPSNNSN